VKSFKRLRTAFVSGAAIVALATLAACGGGGSESDGDLTKITVLLPINSPIVHGFRVADEAGYYADEGLEVDLQFLKGGGEVAQQLLGGNAEVGALPLGNAAEALSQGHDDLRAFYAWTYGSLFSVAVPSDSPITSIEDLKGKKIGVAALSDGAVPIVNGMARSAGLKEGDFDLTAVGDGTALQVRAIEGDQVDGFGGSINDMVALQAQGLDLRFLEPESLTSLPATGLVTTQDYLSSHSEVLEGLVRATSKGYWWAQSDPEATLKLLKKVTPEQFTDSAGEGIFRAVVPMTWNPDGEMGAQTADQWKKFFEFVGVPTPDVDLSTVVVDDLVPAANDFDKNAVQADAEKY